MSKKHVSTDQLISIILKGVDELKGENIQLIDLREIDNTVCDYFVVCSGNSNTHVNAISSSVKKVVGKEAQEKPMHIEGETQANWILMDFVNVVVHIFQKPTRELYDIEGLWGDAHITAIPS